MKNQLLKILGYSAKESSSGIFTKKFADGYIVDVDIENEIINYGGKIKIQTKTSQKITKPEDWVVFECVNKLLEKGYAPENISLEKTYPAGHGNSGRLDICVTRKDKSEYLLIECKTYGAEFDKALKKLYKDGGQLFTYFKFSNKADVIMLYASELQGNTIANNSAIIKIEEEYRTGDVKDFFEKWNKLTKDNGVFDSWVNPYQYISKALTPKILQAIKQEDSGFIFNRFLEILRNNVVSDKGNAFNKIFTLFLCKVYDEKTTKENDELKFQWLEGIDDDVSFQLRLTDLYKNGMLEFLEKQVTDFSEDAFENKFKHLTPADKKDLLYEIHKLRLEKNNEFAIKEVFDNASFKENAKVVKQVVELLQSFRIRYNKRQQYLSDFFELLLTTGLKQEAGQFFTPVPIAQFVIKSIPIDKLVNEKLEKGEANNLLPFVIDYAAGSGHFLTESMHEIQKHLGTKNPKDYIAATAKKLNNWLDDHFDWATQYVYGVEKDYRLVKVGKVGCYLHGDGLANVILSDGLASFKHTKEYKGLLKKTDADFPKENKQFDVVLSNPPYSVPAFKQTARDYYTEKDFDIYDTLTDQSSQIEALFIERTQQLLKDGGMAGIILPSSILSNEGIYTKCREILLKYFDIVAITELGSNTFMATGTNTVVLFLKRRNNYISINIEKAVATFFTNYKDVTINCVEKPINKYISHVWNGISVDDYVSLLKKEPNSNLQKQELYKDYKKKIKAKNEDDFFAQILQREAEKIHYFILTQPQQVVLVKTGDKDAEKRFLGYEFSFRRGSEGIHAMQRGKAIDECTQLFDAEIFDNPTKASTYIYQAFNNDFETPIDSSLQNNISRHNLVDMLMFDRVEFEKIISLNVKKKVKIESKWKLESLGDLIFEQPKSKIKVGTAKDLKEGSFTFFTSGESTFRFNDYLVDGENIFLSTGGNAVVKFYTDKAAYSTDTFVIKSFNEDIITTQYLFIYIESLIKVIDEFYFKGVGLRHLQKPDFRNIQIPLPPKDIQQKIVNGIEAIEKKEAKAKKDVEELKEKISVVVENINGDITKLGDITTKIGSGATPLGGEGVYKTSGVTLIRSQNVYDNEFYTKGLAFIDDEQAQKLNNVTVETNDILFNITGASIARCCMMEDKYLPARVNQHVSIIRVNDKAIPKFVQLLLINAKYKSRLLEIGQGATSREAITKSQLENFEIPLPPLPTQQKIVTEIQKIETKITALQNELATIPAQKEAVLKKYL